MFKKRSLITLSVLLLAFAVSMHSIFKVTKKSQEEYHSSLARLQPKKEVTTSQIHRGLVIKNMWVEKEDQTYQAFIRSQQSTLSSKKDLNKKIQSIEDMEQVTLTIQQKKYFVDQEGLVASSGEAWQQVCVIQMEKGQYHYTQKKFVGDQATIKVYQLPGHELTENAELETAQHILDGFSSQIELSLENKNPKLITHSLDATLLSKELL